MIVENAERFGLAQLHQLRGRVGRGKRKSYCVLVAGSRPGEVARRRLETMRTQHDGFEIARQDLLQRGPGDFLRGQAESSIRQSGGLHFRLADQCEDGEFMQVAFDDAKELLAEDAGLCAYPALRARMERMFTVDLGVLN
jgi:ATP-dependent DNA helicase RecG